VELKLYDVTGRLVKTLAHREFAAGEHNLVWDGTDDEGRLVARGVYFYQLRTPSFVSQKKLAVLRH
jgi:flagellar hook assembly protein FlgD